ncbi:hypothetical protein BJX63DRAFT_434472 [Aspergillus granulosus]|uniref:F-box domain-containing protein n=1 Tax=Aspergillus granulosus TaxID=176169 RepID=A0ABR4H416_9EURO
MSLAQLPTELWILICVESGLEFEDQLNLSLVCWRFRHICAPSVFYSVVFPCTRKGLEGLQELAPSQFRQHVQRLTYYMPPLYTPHAETSGAGERHDDDDGADAALLADVQELIHQRSEENQYIAKSGIDLTALSLALRSLPCLGDLIFTFREFIVGERDRVSRKLDSFRARKETFHYHIPILAQAMSQARAAGRHFSSVRLVGVMLPWFPEPQELGNDEPFRVVLRDSVKQLFGGVGSVRLSLSGAIINLCKRTPLGLSEIQILNLGVEYETFRSFIKYNISTLRRIEFYNVELRNHPEDDERWMRPSFFSQILQSLHPTSLSPPYTWRGGSREGLNWIFTRSDYEHE